MNKVNFDLYNITIDELKKYDLGLISAFAELINATNAYKKMIVWVSAAFINTTWLGENFYNQLIEHGTKY